MITKFAMHLDTGKNTTALYSVHEVDAPVEHEWAHVTIRNSGTEAVVFSRDPAELAKIGQAFMAASERLEALQDERRTHENITALATSVTSSEA